MKRLSVREEQVLVTLWRRPQGATVGEIRAELAAALPYTTIASVLHQLVRKGYAQCHKVTNRQHFQACLSQHGYCQQLVHRLVADHFQHSYAAVVAFCVQEGHVCATDLLLLLSPSGPEPPLPTSI